MITSSDNTFEIL